MDKGSRVKVVPLTHQDKNRVREHGDIWIIERSRGELRPFECLCKAEKTGHLRWWDHGQVWAVTNG